MTTSGIVRWLRTGLWGVTEQGSFAVTHLLANVLLARWLGAESFGLFASLFGLFVLLSYVHTAIIVDPLLVFARRHEHPESYVGTAVRIQFGVAVFGVALAALAALVVLFRYDSQPARVVFGFGVAATCLLTLATVRKAYFCLLSPRSSAIGGVAYLCLLPATIAVLRHLALLDTSSAYLAFGATSLTVSFGLFAFLPRAPREDRPDLKAVMAQHWRYGRWLLGMTPFRWAPLHFYYLALPFLLSDGVSLAGVLRATMVLIAPVQHIQMASSSLLIPAFSERAHGGAQIPRMQPIVTLVGLSAGYWTMLALAGDRLVHLLYGASVAYPDGLLVFLGAMPILTAAITVTQAELFARKRLRLVLAGYLAGSLITFTFGVWATITYGLFGAAVAILSSNAVILGVQGFGVSRPTTAETTEAA